MYRSGLALGKFAPFHRGHQYLLETALREAEHLIVIVYGAKRSTDIPTRTRADWIRSLYPMVEVLEAPEGPEDSGYTPEIMEAQEDFLTSFLAGREIDAFFSSEPYGGHVSLALGCANRLVDPRRATVPVSGTMIREDPWGFRHYVDPMVRDDLVRRLVLIGGPSTGKTSLARSLSEVADEPWCHEFGREYWFRHQVGHRLSMADLELIAGEQARLEASFAREAKRCLIVDTCPLTTWVYAKYWFGLSSPVLDGILDDYLAFPREYWLCDTDMPFDDSPDRSGPASRDAIQRLTVEELGRRGLAWRLVSGSIAARTAAVAATMARPTKSKALAREEKV